MTYQDKIKKVIKLRDEKGLNDTETRKEISKIFGLKKTATNDLFRRIFISTINAKIDRPLVEQSVTHTSDLSNLDDVVRELDIDLSQWKVGTFGVETRPQKDGGNKYQFRISLKRNEVADSEKLLEQFESAAAIHAPKKFVYSKPQSKANKLYLLNLQDVHLGKLACNAETGWGNYDLEIAKQFYRDAVYDLMSKISPDEVRRVMLVTGSDLIHADTESGTTSSGTQLDVDTRWSKVYDESCNLLTEIVEEIASQYEVTVMVMYGNHARTSEYALGSYLTAWFRNHPNVDVDNRRLDRKYFYYLNNLIGFSHGENTKLTELPLMLMRENQSSISAYKHLFFMTGHTHGDRLIDKSGIRIFVAPALCPPDHYHSSNGYIGNVQTSQGLQFGEYGLEAVYYSKSPERID